MFSRSLSEGELEGAGDGVLGPSLQLVVSVFRLDGLDFEGADLAGSGDGVEQVVARVVVGQDDLALIREVK